MMWKYVLSAAVVLLWIPACKKPVPAADGAALFASSCARCHGATGTGGTPAVPGGPAPRNFHDHAFQTQHTDAQIEQTIINGKGLSMPPFGTIFTDAERQALVAYVRSFDSR